MSQNPSTEVLSARDRMLRHVRDLEARLDAAERLRHEPVAVIGIGCRFPGGANGPDAFWELLRSGRDAVQDVPADRWDVDAFYDPDPAVPGKMYTRRGAFLDGVDQFDADFFGISPREATTMDPQQRLLMQVAVEALDHAGQPADRLAGSSTGVFVGISSHNYSELQIQHIPPESIDAYFGTGTSASVAAGRLSYFLGLQGPSMALDTACSSSLVALHLACQSLTSGECTMALVAGVNLMLSPLATVMFCKARMMSPEGRCKSFDAGADGYVRGEGCGVVVLKRLSDAVRDRDRVLAVIRGSAVNQDGRSNGLTAPNGPAQAAVIRQALERARVSARDIGYVEAHGTGTPLGDPVEVHALSSVFAGFRDAGPLLIGSVKTNMGHLEAAAGMAGLIKAILSTVHGEIPPHLHLDRLNPHISIEPGVIEIPRTLRPWPAGRRIAGVSSFSFSGTNAHIILENAPEMTGAAEEMPVEPRSHVVVLSARSEAALSAIQGRWLDWLESSGTDRLNLADIAYTSARRPQWEVRCALVVRSIAELRDAMRALQAGQPVLGVSVGTTVPGQRVRPIVRFSGAASVSPSELSLLRAHSPSLGAVLDATTAVEARAIRAGAERQFWSLAGEMALWAFLRDAGVEAHEFVGSGRAATASDWAAGHRGLEDVIEAAGASASGSLTHLADATPPQSGHVINLAAITSTHDLLETLAQLFAAGSTVRWDILERGNERLIDLPPYPWQTSRYWIDVPSVEDPAGWSHRIEWVERPVVVSSRTSVPRRWLILGGPAAPPSGPTSQSLRVSLESRADTCIWVDAASASAADILAAQSDPRFDGVLILCGTDPSTPTLEPAGVLGELTSMGTTVIDWVRALAEGLAGSRARLWVVTRGTQVDGPGAEDSVAPAALWGLGRVAAIEHPEIWGGLIDLDDHGSEAEAGWVLAELDATDREDQIAIRTGRAVVPRMVPARHAADSPTTLDPDGLYLITGGLGAIGIKVARWLNQRGARHLLLIGRSAPGPEAAVVLDLIRSAGCDVQTARADVSRVDEVVRLIESIRSGPHPLRGIIHAAGVLDDATLLNITAERLERVAGAKAAGACYLDHATRGLELDFMVFFSSAAAVVGSPGQGNYAAANALLGALTRRRIRMGLPALCVHWGPWKDTGMAGLGDAQRWSARGIRLIPETAGLNALGEALDSGSGERVVLPVDPRRFALSFPGSRCPAWVRAWGQLQEEERPADGELVEWARSLETAELAGRIETRVREELAHILAIPPGRHIPDQQGFFDLGMDSLTAVELRQRMQHLAGESLNLPSSIAFDYPTVASLSRFLHSLVLPSEESIAQTGSVVTPGRDEHEPIAIIGIGCRFPGGVSDPESFWQLLRNGVDAVSEVPAGRWDAAAFYDPDPAAIGKMYSRAGAFLEHVDEFDTEFFGISPREAVSMDPQHRLSMEVAWHALEDAGVPPDTLTGSPTGVFIGISGNDYGFLSSGGEPAAIDAYFGTGNAYSALAGRLSFHLGLSGPSIAVDTACSSSLVAVHLACRSLRAAECSLALAGGVNLILTPGASIGLSRARMLSASGRCRTFDESADGYVRGEGCAIVVLKRLGDAMRDGDPVVAVIRGSAVNQDGRSSGLTVPYGPAQRTVIRAAMEDAGVVPDDIGYVEAHGTGTPLGDPIELHALSMVMSARSGIAPPVLVGSVKTNLGHLEAAAGVAGLIKTALALRYGIVPPHLHFQQPTGQVRWDELRLEVPRLPVDFPGSNGSRVAGVSSFGFIGTNAHVVLSSFPVPPPASPTGGVELITMSARSSRALAVSARQFASALRSRPTEFRNMTFTSRCGRTHFAHRAAVVAESPEAAIERLESMGSSPAGYWSGYSDIPARVAFVFGELADPGIAVELARRFPGFESIHGSYRERCRAFGAGPAVDSMCLAAAIFDLWRQLGIEPAAIAGTGAGEGLAHWASGGVSFEDVVAAFAGGPTAVHGPELQGEPVGKRSRVARITMDALKDWNGQVLCLGSGGCLDSRSDSWLAASSVAETLARLYVAGHAIRWQDVQFSTDVRRVSIPHYPFDRQRYWPAVRHGGRGSSGPAEAVHPLLGRYVPTALGQHVYEAHLDVNQPRYVRDHRVYGEVVVPGAAHAAMVIAAACRAFGTAAVELEDIVFPEALVLGTDTTILQVLLQPGGDGAAFTVASREGREGREGRDAPAWATHATGRVRSCSADMGSHEPLMQLWQLADVSVSQKDFYDALASSHIELGPAFRRVDELRTGPLEAFARLRRDPDDVDLDGPLHPGLLDACFQTVSAALPRNPGPDVDAYVPFSVDRIRFFGLPPASGALWCHAQIRTGLNGAGLAADIRVVTEEGSPAAVIEGLHLRRAPRDLISVRRVPNYDGWLYRPVWRPAEAASSRSVTPESAKAIVICASPDVYSASLAAALRTRGHSVHISDETALTVPDVPGFTEVELVCLWGWNAPEPSSIPAGGMMNVQAPLRWLVDLLKGISVERRRIRLTLALRGGEGVANGGVRGLVRAIALERPEFHPRIIEWEPLPPPDEFASQLSTVVGRGDLSGEEEIRFESGMPFVRRLVPLDASLTSSRPPDFRAGSYLITGGFGALGMGLADWLIGRGARGIILMGRRGATDASLSRIESWRESGVRVAAVTGDAAVPDDCARAIRALEPDLPLQGVFHLAGVLDDGTLSQLNWQRFVKVMQPKVEGAWNLHQMTLHAQLECFVLFSSVASLAGSAGQASYSAANAFLDGLSAYRRSAGLPAVSVNWGPWADIGMAASERVEQRLRAQGMAMMTPETGFACLGAVLALGLQQVAVLPVDWDRFRQAAPALAGRPLFREAVPSQRPGHDAAAAEAFKEALRAAKPAERRGVVARAITGIAAQILGLDASRSLDPRQSLTELGMDSLMAVEMRNALGSITERTFPATVLFNYPTIGVLTEFVVNELYGDRAAESVPAPPARHVGVPPAGGNGSLDGLSETELVALLEQELKSLDRERENS